jgi:hypothetical protein
MARVGKEDEEGKREEEEKKRGDKLKIEHVLVCGFD